MVAQLTPWKGQADAIRVVGLLADSRPELRLLFVGSVKFSSRATRFDNVGYVESMKRLIDDLGLGNRVMFLGEREDVPEVLRALDVVLAPSWEEPFGRSVGEAMAMGLPVVATDVGGPAELISDGRDGLLVPPRQPELWASAVKTLIEDGPLRESMGRAARTRALSMLDAREHVREMLSLYSDLVDRD